MYFVVRRTTVCMLLYGAPFVVVACVLRLHGTVDSSGRLIYVVHSSTHTYVFLYESFAGGREQYDAARRNISGDVGKTFFFVVLGRG